MDDTYKCILCNAVIIGHDNFFDKHLCDQLLVERKKYGIWTCRACYNTFHSPDSYADHRCTDSQRGDDEPPAKRHAYNLRKERRLHVPAVTTSFKILKTMHITGVRIRNAAMMSLLRRRHAFNMRKERRLHVPAVTTSFKILKTMQITGVRIHLPRKRHAFNMRKERRLHVQVAKTSFKLLKTM